MASATALLLQAGCRRRAPAALAPATRAGPVATPAEAPDLTLREVAFARLIDGRLAASGTAGELRYHNAGGRFEAAQARVRIVPAPGSGSLFALGDLDFAAPAVRGLVQARRAVASGGVTASAARGDRCTTARATWDGAEGTVRSDGPAEASGPGYVLHGQSLLARTDGTLVQFSGDAGGALIPAGASPGPARLTGGPARRVAAHPTRRE